MKVADVSADAKLEDGRRIFVLKEVDVEGQILTRDYLFSLIHSFLIISVLGYGYLGFTNTSYEYIVKASFYGVMSAMSFSRKREVYFLMHIFYIIFYAGFGIYYLSQLWTADLSNDIMLLASAFYTVLFLSMNYLIFFMICKAHDILLKESKQILNL
ncbi:hypothetical protein FO519_003083 [Halicephalobus sp. NKZ332]|nr:hypothetical protein FO519_003083 [Halicephalobus sp. NKZ332]